MQLEEIQIPVYFGGFIDVFWDSDGIIRVDTERDRLSICANGPALAALAVYLRWISPIVRIRFWSPVQTASAQN